MLAVKCGFHWATAAVLHRHASAEPSRADPRRARCWKLRTVTPPLVAQRSAPRCGGGHVHPHTILILSLSKCAFFWQTAGSPVYCAPVYCEHVGAESNRNVIATPKSDGAPFLDVLTRSLEHKRAARGDFSGDIDRLAVVLPRCPQIGHDLVNQASCLGVVHPECALELIGERTAIRRKADGRSYRHCDILDRHRLNATGARRRH